MDPVQSSAAGEDEESLQKSLTAGDLLQSQIRDTICELETYEQIFGQSSACPELKLSLVKMRLPRID